MRPACRSKHDFQSRIARDPLGFIGIDDIAFIRAEGLAYGPKQRRKGDARRIGSVLRSWRGCPRSRLNCHDGPALAGMRRNGTIRRIASYDDR